MLGLGLKNNNINTSPVARTCNINVEVNGTNEGIASTLGTIEIDITDGTNPVTPNDVTIVGRKVTVEVPSGGGSPSGVAFEFIRGFQRTSYRTGDEGWRVQNGWFDYTPPANPKTRAQLDYGSANFPYVLKDPLVVGGVSSTVRFVDVNGIQAFSGTGNANLVVIDKLTGLAWLSTRLSSNTWENQIDAALAISNTINSVSYSDYYLPTGIEYLSLVFGRPLAGNLIDSASSVTLISNLGANFHTATTSIDVNRSYFAGLSGENWLERTLKTNAFFALAVSKEFMNLITAP